MEFLGSKHIASAPDIGRALNMTTANARHHLSILVNEGALEVVGERRVNKRGRPSLLYATSSRIHQHNLDRLSSALLQELLNTHTPEDREITLRRIANKLIGVHKPAATLTQGLYMATQLLNKLNYDAHWEAHTEAPYLIFNFCPYAKILPEHPELCALDALMIEELLDVPAIQLDKLVKDERGVTYCRFLLGHRPDSRPSLIK